MFLLLPAMYVFFWYLFLAVLPALILLIYVYRQDRVEKEPVGLLIRLIFMGVIAAFLSMLLERIGSYFLDRSSLNPSGIAYTAVMAFLVVAVVEEGTKYALMAAVTWKSPAFNYRFDGIVYSVFASLGFAAMENIIYEMGYGPGVLVGRSVLAIPGHMSFGVLFGIFYGRAKIQQAEGHHIRQVLCIVTGYILAVFLHGIYDTCAMLGTGASTLVFGIVVVVIYLVCFLLVRRESSRDENVYYHRRFF